MRDVHIIFLPASRIYRESRKKNPDNDARDAEGKLPFSDILIGL